MAALLDEALLALLEREREEAREAMGHAKRKRTKLRKALQSVEDGWVREQRLLGYHCDQAVDGLMAGYSAERRWRRAVGMLRPDELCIQPRRKPRSDEKGRAQAEWRARVVTQVLYIDQALWDEVMRGIESVRRESNRWWPGLYLRGLPDGYWVWAALHALLDDAPKKKRREHSGATKSQEATGGRPTQGKRGRVSAGLLP